MKVNFHGAVPKKETHLVTEYAATIAERLLRGAGSGNVAIDDLACSYYSNAFCVVLDGTANDDPFFFSVTCDHVETAIDLTNKVLTLLFHNFKVDDSVF